MLLLAYTFIFPLPLNFASTSLLLILLQSILPLPLTLALILFVALLFRSILPLPETDKSRSLNESKSNERLPDPETPISVFLSLVNAPEPFILPLPLNCREFIFVMETYTTIFELDLRFTFFL